MFVGVKEGFKKKKVASIAKEMKWTLVGSVSVTHLSVCGFQNKVFVCLVGEMCVLRQNLIM
jgi:hypothetical protein